MRRRSGLITWECIVCWRLDHCRIECHPANCWASHFASPGTPNSPLGETRKPATWLYLIGGRSNPLPGFPSRWIFRVMRASWAMGRKWIGPLLLVLAGTTHLRLVAAVEVDEDWPRFLGPRANNVSSETGLLEKWPTNGVPLVWGKTDWLRLQRALGAQAAPGPAPSLVRRGNRRGSRRYDWPIVLAPRLPLRFC